MYTDLVVACLEVLFRYSPRQTGGHHNKLVSVAEFWDENQTGVYNNHSTKIFVSNVSTTSIIDMMIHTSLTLYWRLLIRVWGPFLMLKSSPRQYYWAGSSIYFHSSKKKSHKSMEVGDLC